MVVRCGYPTRDGLPCANRVAPGSDHCAANHPVVSSRPAPVGRRPLATIGEAHYLAFDDTVGVPLAMDAALSRLKPTLDSEEAYAVIDDQPVLEGSTWTAGSCRVLARALSRVVPKSRIWTVVDSSMHPEPQHYAVRLPDGRFLDGDGVSSSSQLIRRLEQDELLRRCRLVEGELPSPDIPAPEAAVNELAVFLRRRMFDEEL